MALIELPKEPIKPALTSKQAWESLKRNVTSIYLGLERQHSDAFSFLYAQPNPLEVIREAGTDAKMLFDVSSKIQELLKTVNSSYAVKTPPVPVEFNEDGSLKEQQG